MSRYSKIRYNEINAYETIMGRTNRLVGARNPRSSSRPGCPFTILADTNELQRHHRGYRFEMIEPPVLVETANLFVGDYTIAGLQDKVIVERKSKADLYQSVTKRANWIERLELMARFDYAAIVVEAGWTDCIVNPGRHAKLHPASLRGSILAWRQRYKNVDWIFCDWSMIMSGDHEGTHITSEYAAEMTTFRVLERYYQDTINPKAAHDD